VNLTRHNLAVALSYVDKSIERRAEPRLVETIYSWSELIKDACFKIIARDVVGPEVELIRRAARQMEQSGYIQWDDPETEAEITGEQPYLDRIMAVQKKTKVRQERSAKHYAQAHLIVLTEKEKARIADISYIHKLGDRIKGSLNYLPPEAEFQFDQIGVDWGGGWVGTAQLANSLIRHGILEVVRPHPTSKSASQATVRTGPKYPVYMKEFKLCPIGRGYWPDNVSRQIPPGLLQKYDFCSDES